MNIAESFVEYYESEEFEGDYYFFAQEDEEAAAQALQELWLQKDVWAYFYPRNPLGRPLLYKEALELVERLFDAGEYRRFCNYYVGSYCISSVSFGELCESLDSLYNAKTGKKYGSRYLKRVFEEAGFYVDDKFAYYDLIDSGVYIDFRDFDKDELTSILEGFARGPLEGSEVAATYETIFEEFKNVGGYLSCVLSNAYNDYFVECNFDDKEDDARFARFCTRLGLRITSKTYGTGFYAWLSGVKTLEAQE